MASRSSGGRRLMEPCDRDELALKRIVKGGCTRALEGQMGAD